MDFIVSHIDEKNKMPLMMYTKPLMSNQSDVLFGMHKAMQVVRAETLEVIYFFLPEGQTD